MKAQAKKILALIMAMVMCLSLAAPAFAGTYNKPAAGTNAVGTWTYDSTNDNTVFVEVPSGKNAAGETVGVVADTSPYDGWSFVVKGTDTFYKNVAGDAVTKVDKDDQATPLTGSDLTEALAYDYTEAPSGKYKALETFATRIDASANDGTYKVMGFRKGNIYTDVDDKNGGDQFQEELIASGDVKKGKSSQPANVTMSDKVAGTDLIGSEFKSDSYKVTYTNANAHAGVDATLITDVKVAVAKDNTTRKAIDDVTTGWATLAEGQTFKPAGDSKDYQVKGTVYQEAQEGNNGLVNVYFKLKVVENDSFTSDELYFVNKSGVARIAEGNVDAMATALAGATQCDNFGDPKDGGKGVKDAGCALEVTSTAARPTHYAISVINQNDVEVTPGTKSVTAGSITATTATLATVKVSDDKKTGSFQMSLKNETAEKKADHFFVTDLTEATELITALFADATTNCTLVSVEAASGNYFTVNVKMNAVSTEYAFDSTTTHAYGKNVFYYVAGSKDTALLVDLSVGGQYNATNTEGANAKVVEAGTEALGPVIVKKSDVDTANYNAPSTVQDEDDNFTAATANFLSTEAFTAGRNRNYYYFSSVKDMKAKITAKNCKNAKSIPYVQVVLNPYNGDKQNKLVVEVKKTRKVAKDTLKLSGDADAVSKNIVTDMFAQQDTCKVELAKDWDTNAFATPYADFVKKGTLDVAAAAHGDTVDIVEQVDATCKQKGQKITKTTCKICNTVISEKTEEIPVVTDPVETNTGVEVEDANGEKVKKIWFDQSDPTEKKGGGGDHAPKTGHFITKAVTTTTVSEDKKSSVVTTEFYCNHGELQPQLTRVVNVTKIGLQHSGNWNLFKLDGRSSLIYDNDDVWNMFGYDGVTIIDSDVENANLPMNRKKADIPAGTADANDNGDIVISFAKNRFDTGAGSNRRKEDDGTWVAYTSTPLNSVYATANSLPETKWYAAKLTVKDVKERTAQCQAGSGVIEVDVYDVTGINTNVAAITNKTAEAAISSNATLAKNLKEGKVVLKQHFSQNVEMRPIRNHEYDEVSGVCRYCNKTREAVESATFTADTIAVENLKWTGNKVQPKVTVMNTKGEKLLKGVDYLLEEIEDTDAGEHTITVVGQDEYKGNRVTVPFTIEKVAGTLKKKSAPSKLTASATKKVTGQIKMTVKGGKVAKYKVTGKVSGVSVNKKGKITVKKGNKKAGTLKVKVTMTPDANHTAAKAVTVKVAIKAAPAAKKTTKK